jgi:hypothetical protein
MEIGAFFILLLVLVVVGVLGGGLWVIARGLRRGKLASREDMIERDGDREEDRRPSHVRVSNEQRSRYVTNR